MRFSKWCISYINFKTDTLITPKKFSEINAKYVYHLYLKKWIIWNNICIFNHIIYMYWFPQLFVFEILCWIFILFHPCKGTNSKSTKTIVRRQNAYVHSHEMHNACSACFLISWLSDRVMVAEKPWHNTQLMIAKASEVSHNIGDSWVFLKLKRKVRKPEGSLSHGRH